MKSFILDAKKQETRLAEIEAELEVYYDIIGTDIVEIPTRYIGGKAFDIICDEEALLKEEKIPSAINPSGTMPLFGTLIFAHHNDEGEMIGLDEEDIKILMKHLRSMESELTETPVMVMLLDEWR